ncbi:MAG: hypothetical protein JXR25_04075 [Pontiellaceae bacterium]|nr:hypothetical protein [Pontiellaceae bacterium]MBN2783980.1 hypothetical protein [Pontiellaceae bacterium]
MNQLIESIHTSGFHACVVVSGGGIGAIQDLLCRSGASRFVLDLQVPYSRESMNLYLGAAPDAYCSEETARLLAKAALNRAERISTNPIGIACTAALRTLEERGDTDRAHLCICSSGQVLAESMELDASLSREQQDQLVSRALIELIARFVSL